jgi:Amt family ammonium transporter
VALTFGVVFALSFATFSIIKATVGLRVDDEVELAGLDITEHGMYGYPEAFIPEPELVGYGATSSGPAVNGAPAAVATTREVTA